MGRVGINIVKEELIREIQAAEAANNFANESALFNFICKTPWAKTIKDALGRSRELTPILVYSRVKEWKIPIKTVKGKRGNPNIGVKLTPAEKEERIQNRPGYLKVVQNVRFNVTNHQKSKEGKDFKGLTPAKENLLKRFAKGNVRAAVKLKCLECCCGEASEAAACEIFSCPLYLLNPFLRGGAAVEDAIEPEVQEE